MEDLTQRVFEVSNLTFTLNEAIDYKPYVNIFYGNERQSSKVMEEQEEGKIYKYEHTM